MRSENVLNSLASLIGISETPSSSPIAPKPLTLGEPNTNQSKPTSSSNSPNPKTKQPHTTTANESARNLLTICRHFNTKLAEMEKLRGPKVRRDASEVLEVIKANLDGLDLIDSPAMEDVRLYVEADWEGYFRELVRTVAEDTKELIPF
jgi:hypothetical protein